MMGSGRCCLCELVEGHSHQVREHNHVLELSSEPDQVEGVLVEGNLVGQGCGIVAAQPGASVGVDANAKVADTGLEMGVAGYAGYAGVGIVVDLRRVGHSLVFLVVERQEEDVGDQG